MSSSGSHLVFVPSLRDVHHEPVYPQPPFTFSELPREDKKVPVPTSGQPAVGGVKTALGVRRAEKPSEEGAQPLNPKQRCHRLLPLGWSSVVCRPQLWWGGTLWLLDASIHASSSFQRVQFVSEPCSLSINGVMFGLTSTDLLFHIGAEEIFR